MTRASMATTMADRNKTMKVRGVCAFIFVFLQRKKQHLRYLSAEVAMSPIVFWTLQSPKDSGPKSLSGWWTGPPPLTGPLRVDY